MTAKWIPLATPGSSPMTRVLSESDKRKLDAVKGNIGKTLANLSSHDQKIMVLELMRDLNKEELRDLEARRVDIQGQIDDQDAIAKTDLLHWLNSYGQSASKLKIDHAIAPSGNSEFSLRTSSYERTRWAYLLPKLAKTSWETYASKSSTMEEFFAAIRDGSIKNGVFGDLETGYLTTLVALGSWYHNGLPRITIGHKHAASLMCTTMAPEYVRELRAPWDSFMIDVPRGLLPSSILDGRELAHANVFTANGLVEANLFGEYADQNEAESTKARKMSSCDLATLCEDASSDHPAFQLLARLVVGVVAELMTHRPAHYKERGPSAVRRNPRGEPLIRTFELRRDVRVDCREAVKNFAKHGKRATGKITVQTLVAGHWRNQVCGTGNKDRKYIHIEPFWRGPEGAPIALRPHKLRGDE